MSRSFRHTNIRGITGAESENTDKQLCNRMKRKDDKRILNKLKYDIDRGYIFKYPNEIYNNYLFAKDGKQFFSDNKFMRK